MNFGDIRGSLDKMIQLLKGIDRNTNQSSCCIATTSAGTGSIPEGFKTVSIMKNDTGIGVVNITLSDGSVFPLTAQGEVFVDASSDKFVLPAYNISSTLSATWVWHGIK